MGARVVDANQVFSGTEPVFKGVDFDSLQANDLKMLIAKSLNWYAANSSEKDSMKWAEKEFPKVDIKFSGTLGYICRMIQRGFPRHILAPYFPKLISVRVDGPKKGGSAPPPKLVVQTPRPKVDVDLLNALEFIDIVVDDFIKEGKTSRKSSFVTLNNPQIKAVLELVEKYIDEFTGCSTKEEYNFNKRKENALIGWLEATKLQLNGKKAQRKPRTQKAVPPTKIAAKYRCSDFEIYKTVDPAILVGAQQALIYDTKTRVAYLVFAGTNPLSIDKINLINFDEKKSVGKLLRKPDEVIPQLMAASKAAVPKRFAEIKSAEKPVKPRSQSTFCILKVW